MENSLKSRVGNAARWSSITELCAKLVAPVSSMILARLLTPDAFGVVATINIIISFTDMFTDAGFQKYLIQHEFDLDDDIVESTNVAFWTNLAISILIWLSIIIFRNQLAALVGNPDKGNVLAISCITLPMTSFSSIQMALFKREFDFKSLFYTRILGVCIPLFVTIPLAFLLRSYWALILGMIIKNFSDAIILTISSKWKPTFYYSFARLKEMLSFSIWTLFEQISIWLTSYIGTFIVGIYLSNYYVGLYKTSMSTVTQFTTLITSATTPVLFSALSRLQNNNVEFENTFLKFQRLVGLLIMPMGIGMFLYKDLITTILLGSQWTEASMFIGVWGLTSSLGILLNNFCSEVYRALGKPKVSLAIQLIHLVFLVPSLIFSAKQGFVTLYWARSLIRFQLYICQIIVMSFITKISFSKMLGNLYPSVVGSLSMCLLALGLQWIGDGIIWSLCSISICAIFYSCIIMLFTETRREIYQMIIPMVKKLKNRVIKVKESIT